MKRVFIEWSEYYPFPYVYTEEDIRNMGGCGFSEHWNPDDSQEEGLQKSLAHFAEHSHEVTDEEWEIIERFRKSFLEFRVLFSKKEVLE